MKCLFANRSTGVIFARRVATFHLWSLPSEQKCRYADITEKGLAK